MSDELPNWNEEKEMYESVCESCNIIWSSPNGEGPLGWKTSSEILDDIIEDDENRRFYIWLVLMMDEENVDVICEKCISMQWSTFNLHEWRRNQNE